MPARQRVIGESVAPLGNIASFGRPERASMTSGRPKSFAQSRESRASSRATSYVTVSRPSRPATTSRNAICASSRAMRRRCRSSSTSSTSARSAGSRIARSMEDPPWCRNCFDQTCSYYREKRGVVQVNVTKFRVKGVQPKPPPLGEVAPKGSERVTAYAILDSADRKSMFLHKSDLSTR